ncbi:helix-turn-helix domain-containing protein [Oleiharenicola lentus]|uniref:helix-turn-helix domain-containing protein n=1 Tax=Oleiharenicola lentus TaxID=2508720 RepID=UPI003F67022A
MIEKKRWRNLAAASHSHHLAIILFQPGRPAQYHTHDFPEVFWVERGSGVHRINGEEHSVTAGDVIFVRAEDEHVLGAADARGFTLVNLAYDPRVRSDLLRRHPETLGAIFDSKEKLPHRARLTPPTRRELAALAADAGSRLALEHFLLGLALQAQPPRSHSAIAGPDWLQHACEQLQRPELLAQGVPGFVKVAGRSGEHVARTMRQVLGLTPSDYLNRQRMEYAARELRITDRSIASIALDCGLNNLSHFYALFRAAHGLAPRRYRQQQRPGVV